MHSDFTIEEEQSLQEAGYVPTWIEDLCAGDEFAIKVYLPNYGFPSSEGFSKNHGIRICTAESVIKSDAATMSLEGEIEPHYICKLIVADHELGLMKHMTYSKGWPVYKKATDNT